MSDTFTLEKIIDNLAARGGLDFHFQTNKAGTKDEIPAD